MKALYVQPTEAFGGAERQGVVHIPWYFPYFPDATHAQLTLAGNLRHAPVHELPNVLEPGASTQCA